MVIKKVFGWLMETYECPYALCMNLKKIIWNEKTIEKKMEFLSCTNNIIKKVAKRRIYIKKCHTSEDEKMSKKESNNENNSCLHGCFFDVYKVTQIKRDISAYLREIN